MRDLPIAYGNSCFAKIWTNKTTTFDDLCERLKTTIRTTETAEEYLKLPKTERDRAKDKGGFVGGQLKNNRRKIDSVVCRSMLTMDADHAVVGFIDLFLRDFQYASCVYTTHSHTPEAPRCRIIVPLTRDVSPDEYVALTRFLAADWGIDQFDECSYKPNQLMYWPTTPSNGEFISRTTGGDWLNPDTVLTAHPNWKDCSLLPTSSRESAVRENIKKPQEDPLTKSGLIGAFCRAYSITKAIDTFLSDIYTPSVTEDHYDYIPGEGTAGVVIYDDKFAYSHHATDPACGKLLNAFDIVRIHKFGDDDDKKSMKDMLEFAISIDEVKLQIAKEKAASIDEDFTEDWHKKLQYMTRSTVLQNSVWNEMLILNNDPDITGFAYNEMANRIQVTGVTPWDRPVDNKFWRDADTAQLKALIDIRYVCFSDRNHNVSFTKVADDRRFHPIRDYLDSLSKWDGVPRCDTLFSRYLQAEDTPYSRAISRKTLVADVRRIYHPGTKYDSVTVLDGAQGIGKSSLWKELAGDEYFSDALSLTDMDDKSGAEKLQGFWIVEIGELAGMKKADIEKVVTAAKGRIQRTEVSNAEVWCECFGRNIADLKPSDSYAIAALMTKVEGWERTIKTKRQPIYGKQRLYIRCCSSEKSL